MYIYIYINPISVPYSVPYLTYLTLLLSKTLFPQSSYIDVAQTLEKTGCGSTNFATTTV